MITAVDSSVLLSIFKGEPNGETWLKALIARAAIGELRICDIVAAEVGGFFLSVQDLQENLDKLSIAIEPISLESCYLAGRIFQSYRKEGGRRNFLIPDFLIGAHALIQCNELLAIDRGYLRKYFSKLKVVTS